MLHADDSSKVRIRRLKALFLKEFYHIIRDPSSLLISLVLPLLLLFFYGYGISLDLEHVKIGLVLEDTSPDAQSFAKALTDSRYFNVSLARESKQFKEDLVKGKIKGIVVVPSYFSEFRRRPDHVAPIQVITDGSEPNTASFVQNYIQGAFQQWLREEQISSHMKGESLVTAEARFWYNEELNSHYFLIPGSLAIIMTLIGTLLTALVVAKEWERGTMEALMSTPVRIIELVIGKLVPYFLLGICSFTLSFILAVIIYGIPFKGSIWVLGIVASTFLLTALGQGLLLSTFARNQFVAAQAAIVSAFLPSFILSGFVFEIGSMPLFIRLITYLIPARYFVSSLQTLFLVGNVGSLIAYNVLMIICLGTVLYIATARMIVKRLD